MGNIDHLLPDGNRPLADREAMLREVLVMRWRKWLAKQRFHLCELHELRSIARDIQNLPPDDRELPKDLDLLNHADFSSVSPANRKQALTGMLKFVGTGGYLYGEDAWCALQAEVERLCQDSSHRLPMIDAWTLDTVCGRAQQVIERDVFSICAVTDLHSSLNHLRRSVGLPPFESESDPCWAALRALHCKKLNEMPSATKVGLAPAIRTVLGLEREDTRLLLGNDRLEPLLVDLDSQIAGKPEAPPRSMANRCLRRDARRYPRTVG